jgi:hypothetical protein
MPPPVLLAAPVVQSTEMGARCHFSRISRFFSKPPLAMITPRRARISCSSP